MDLNQFLESGILEPWQVELLRQQQAQGLEDLQDQVMRQAEDVRAKGWMAQHDAEFGSDMTGLAEQLRAKANAASNAVYRRHLNQ